MLSLPFRLLFPKLHRISSVTIKNKERSLYALDWSHVEKEKENQHKKWRDENWSDREIPYIPSLPAEYMEWSDNLTFVLDSGYRNEIRRMARRAAEEWGTERGFDTMIREVCLGPAIEFVWCSFYLICDCIYDKETKYFSRKDKDKIARYVLAYRFWCHQTGGGLIKDHARFDKLKWWVSRTNTMNTGYKEEGRLFLEAIKEHEEEWEKNTIWINEEDSKEIKDKA